MKKVLFIFSVLFCIGYASFAFEVDLRDTSECDCEVDFEDAESILLEMTINLKGDLPISDEDTQEDQEDTSLESFDFDYDFDDKTTSVDSSLILVCNHSIIVIEPELTFSSYSYRYFSPPDIF